MNEDNSALLDLCRLNLMEENVRNTTANDTEATLKAIEFKRRQVIEKMPEATLAPDAMERHIADNTHEGMYPWTEHPTFKGEIEEESK